MRSDFDHVVATGGHHKSERVKNRGKLRGTNNFQPMRAEYSWREGRKLHLTPLNRFLQKSVGRKWDDLYSEVCRKFDKRTPEGRLFHEWLENRVETKFLRGSGGVVRVHTSIGLLEPFAGDFYVDPEGYLRVAPRRRRFRRSDIFRDLTVVSIDKTHEYRRVEGIWYWFEFKFVIRSIYEDQQKVLEEMDRPYTYGSIYRRYKVWTEKRQLRKKELKLEFPVKSGSPTGGITAPLVRGAVIPHLF